MLIMLILQGEEGGLSLTTRLRSANTTRGLPVNYCSGFRALDISSTSEVGGMYSVSLFTLFTHLNNYIIVMTKSIKIIVLLFKANWQQSLCQFLISKLMLLHHIISQIDTYQIFLFCIAGVARHGFSLEVNAKDYGFQPTDTPRTDRSVKFSRFWLFLLLILFYPISETYQQFVAIKLFLIICLKFFVAVVKVDFH